MGSVLFVDDDLLILRSIQRSVIEAPFKAFFANSAQEALKMLADEHVDVLVTDMRMPQISGLDLLKQVKLEFPHVVRIVLSGYAQMTQVVATVNQGEIFRFITKPWDYEKDLMPAILDALAHVESKASKEKDVQGMEARNELYQNMLNHFQAQKKILVSNINTMIRMNDQMQTHFKSPSDTDTEVLYIETLFNHNENLSAHMPYELHVLNHEKIMQQLIFFLEKNQLQQLVNFRSDKSPHPTVYGIPWILAAVASSVIEDAHKHHECKRIFIELSSNIAAEYTNDTQLYLSCLMDITVKKPATDDATNKWIETLKVLHSEQVAITYAMNADRLVVQLKQSLQRRN